MKVYGYIRVSTNKQDYENQKHAILDFANQQKLGNVELVSETASGKVSWKNRTLAGLIDSLKKNDVLIVSELSRLGRSMLEIMELLSKLTRKEVKIFALKGGYELANNLQSKVLAFAFAIAAEVERELISLRTKEALAIKRAEGVHLGRPKGSISKSKLDGQEEKIKELLKYKVSKSAIARMLDISRPALLDFIKSRGVQE
ncbi:MAG: recombinase family protein [Nitrospiraceae bacterium]|nr:recombinase family protein [Nitrospiraceae bacterium]